MKLEMTPEELCGQKSIMFLKFTHEIFSINFEQKPEYEKLKIMIQDIMTAYNLQQDDKFDWDITPQNTRLCSKET